MHSVLSTTFLRLGNWLRERSRNLAWGDLACIPLHWGMCLLSYWPAYAQWGALGGPGGFGDLAPGALSMLHLFISFWTLLTKGPLEFRVRVPYHNSVLTPFSPFSPICALHPFISHTRYMFKMAFHCLSHNKRLCSTILQTVNYIYGDRYTRIYNCICAWKGNEFLKCCGSLKFLTQGRTLFVSDKASSPHTTYVL